VESKVRALPSAPEPNALQRILDFVDPAQYGKAFLLSEWSVAEEVEELVTIAREDPSTKMRMAAMQRLHKMGIEALVLSGHIRQMTAQRTLPGGSTMHITAAATSQQSLPGAPHILESEQGITKFLEAQNKDNEDDQDPTVVHQIPQEVSAAEDAEEVLNASKVSALQRKPPRTDASLLRTDPPDQP